MDGIPIGALSALDGVGVVGVVVLLGLGFASSRLYTRGQVKAIETAHAREIERMETAHVRERDDIAHDRDQWRAAHMVSEQARLEEREHSQSLVRDVIEPVKAFFEEFRRTARQRSTPE